MPKRKPKTAQQRTKQLLEQAIDAMLRAQDLLGGSGRIDEAHDHLAAVLDELPDRFAK